MKIDWQWVPYEFRRLGGMGQRMPGLILLPFIALGGLMQFLGAQPIQIARILTAALELGIPLGAGIVAAVVVGDDPGIDLQLATTTSYRLTALRRLALIIAWHGGIALAWSVLLTLAGWWAAPQSFLPGQLIWLAPLLWFVSVGALPALGLRSGTAGTAVLGGVWVLENVFHDLVRTRAWLRPFFFVMTTYAPGDGGWLENRLELIGTAAILLLGLLFVLGNSERLATRGEA